VHPYFYLGVKEGYFEEVETYLRRKYERHICKIDQIEKEDLELRNHLSGLKKAYLRLSFMTVQSLLVVRDEMMPLVKKNKERSKVKEIYQGEDFNNNRRSKSGNILEAINDIREYDVTYYIRAAIDKGTTDLNNYLML
jgi:DNA polymerase epsilon subunit 1